MNSKKVLMIEKNLGVRKLIGSVLRHNGYLVEVTDNKKSGILMVLKEPHNLILLSLDLSDENPIDALNSLKSNPATRQIPVVAYTERADKVTINEALHQGAAWVLTIPVTSGELLKILNSCLSPPETVAEHKQAAFF